VTWYFRSKAPWLGTRNSPPQHTPLNSIVAQAHTAASNEFNRSKPSNSASMCSSVTSSHFSFFDDSGTIFEAFVIWSWLSPFHLAPLTECQNEMPDNQLSMHDLEMLPMATAVNAANNHSGGGIHNSWGMLKASQNWVNLRRPAPQLERVFSLREDSETLNNKVHTDFGRYCSIESV
jgi:hypothetical protein